MPHVVLKVRQALSNHHVAALIGYTLLTLGLTYPSAFRITTHIPGEGDAPWFLWQLWWFKHALIDLTTSPFVTDLIYYPLTDVPVTWQTPINEFASIPIQTATNVVVLYNLLFLGTFILSGYFTYLLSLSVVDQKDLAFVAGVLFAFCSYRNVRAIGHLSLLTTQWMPLALLLAINLHRRPTWQRGAAAGIGAALVMLSTPYYAALFLLPAAAVGGFYLLGWRLPALREPRLWSATALAALIALVITAPFYLSFVQLEPDIGQISRDLARFASENSADLLSWILPPGAHPVWGQVAGPIYAQFTTQNLMETTIFVGFIPLVLMFASLFVRRFRPQIYFWQLLALTAWLLSLGPELYVNGSSIFAWMPFRYLMQLPGFDSLRAPSRSGITVALTASILAIMVLYVWRRHYPALPWRGLLIGGTALVIFNTTFLFPYPSSSTAVPNLYTEIAQNDQQAALLELPAGELWQAHTYFFDDISWYMYYQTVHRKPIISGYLAKRPGRLLDPERELPFVKRFFNDNDEGRSIIDMPDAQLIMEQGWPDDIRIARQILHELGIGHVVLHCRPALDAYCRPARSLLHRALGLPKTNESQTFFYEVGTPTYLARDTAHLVDIGPVVDAVNTTSQQTEYGIRYSVTDTAVFTFTVPFDGRWMLRGEISGGDLSGLRVSVNGKPTEFESLPYAADSTALAATVDLDVGEHQIVIAADTTRAEENPCDSLCISNPALVLKSLRSGTESEALATFVNELGKKFTLLDARLIEHADDADPASASFELLTEWAPCASCGDELAAESMPAVYVHVTDAGGNQITGQADHVLGERHVLDQASGAFFDLVELPAEAMSTPSAEVRIGLWNPATDAYYWTVDPTDSDGANRLWLRDLAPLKMGSR